MKNGKGNNGNNGNRRKPDQNRWFDEFGRRIGKNPSNHKLLDAFRRFDRENPIIWQYFCMFTEDRIKLGFEEYCISGVCERVRWETRKKTTDPDYKISNSHRAYYARKWLDLNPEHPGFFVLHVVQCEPWQHPEQEEFDL